MSDVSQLPHLIRLLDDESPTVRQSLAEAFAKFGPELEEELARLPHPPDPDQLQEILRLIQPESGAPEFQPGDLVKHRRYGYRGVIVAVDSSCDAPEAWYNRNQTQPNRDQPWYHVLAHKMDGNCYYAAQSSLQSDDDEKTVKHPLISRFFSDFINGKYIRNDKPWPDST